jgi:hypothetical protein
MPSSEDVRAARGRPLMTAVLRPVLARMWHDNGRSRNSVAQVGGILELSVTTRGARIVTRPSSA